MQSIMMAKSLLEGWTHGLEPYLPSLCEGLHHGGEHLWVHMRESVNVLQR